MEKEIIASRAPSASGVFEEMQRKSGDNTVALASSGGEVIRKPNAAATHIEKMLATTSNCELTARICAIGVETIGFQVAWQVTTTTAEQKCDGVTFAR
jgi:hypothetical protein